MRLYTPRVVSSQQVDGVYPMWTMLKLGEG